MSRGRAPLTVSASIANRDGEAIRAIEMNVLAFDTASSIPAIALFLEGRVIEERLPAERRASEELLPGVERILSKAHARLSDCSRIAVCSGPGSFTGVRVGLATAWGLGRALGVPVESVPTLEALAEAARAPGLARVAALLDAGRGEVVVELFSLEEERARSLSGAERLQIREAAGRCRGREFVSLPENLLGFSGRALLATPAQAMAVAVARAPRPTTAEPPVAIYARSSAAEEKLGAS